MSPMPIPMRPLPEIKLRADAVVPPMVLNEDPVIAIPSPPFPMPAVPATFVPMKFPCTTFCELAIVSFPRWPQAIPMPSSRLPEIRFPAPLAVPPMVLPDEPMR